MIWFFLFGCQSTSAEGLSGQQVYERSCVNCHKSNGQGIANVYPPLADSKWVTGDPSIPARIILHGLTGEIVVKNVKYNSTMLGWEASLSDENIAKVLTYIRTSWGNEASSVSTEDVKKIREKYPQHAKWTVSDFYYVKELPKHKYNACSKTVADQLVHGLLGNGISSEKILRFPNELSAAKQALNDLQTGDLLLLLTHEDYLDVLRLISEE